MPAPSQPSVHLLTVAVLGLFSKKLRGDAAFVLLDAVPLRLRRNRMFRMIARYVQVHWWGWPAER